MFQKRLDKNSENSIDVEGDLCKLFSNFEWNLKGIIDANNRVYPIPKIPQVITGIFEFLGMRKVVELASKYKCEAIESGSREYPDLTLRGGKLGTRFIAVEIKTARKTGTNTCSRMSLGSCAGYFLQPQIKMYGCKFPYGVFTEHLIVGFIYTWNKRLDSLHMVSDVEIIIQQKWKIASKSTATGDTAAIGAVTNVTGLKNGRGEFTSSEEFEKYWREKGRNYKR